MDFHFGLGGDACVSLARPQTRAGPSFLYFAFPLLDVAARSWRGRPGHAPPAAALVQGPCSGTIFPSIARRQGVQLVPWYHRLESVLRRTHAGIHGKTRGL